MPLSEIGHLGALEAVVVGAGEQVDAQVEREVGDRAVTQAQADAAHARGEGPAVRVPERHAFDAHVDAELGTPARRRDVAGVAMRGGWP